MIYDGMSALKLYRGLYKGLDIVIDWLADHDLSQLDFGKYEIMGKKCYVMIQDAKTRTYESARYEIHHRYMDLQIDIDGTECFKTTPGMVEPIEPFDQTKDKGYCMPTADNHDELEGTLANNHFAIFVVGEPHMPNLVIPGKEISTLKKACIKIIGDQFWNEVQFYL